jgi:hypothetical protein
VSLTRINPSGESLFALGEKLFALGEVIFGPGEVESILREIVSGIGEILLALGKIHFASGEILFRLKQIVFGLGEVEFMFKTFVCSRDVTERPSKMIESFDFQIPILCGDQASISRFLNCQQPPKNAK